MKLNSFSCIFLLTFDVVPLLVHETYSANVNRNTHLRTPTIVAGTSCEFQATDNCESPKIVPRPLEMIDSNRVITVDETPFCVNNGVCVQYLDTSVVKGNGQRSSRANGLLDNLEENEFYCECDESKWTGRRCELAVGSIIPSPAPTLVLVGTDSSSTPTDSQTKDEDEEERSSASNHTTLTGMDGDNSDSYSNPSGWELFLIVVMSSTMTALVGWVGYRQYQRFRFRKELDDCARIENLQPKIHSEETVSEANCSDDMISVNLSGTLSDDDNNGEEGHFTGTGRTNHVSSNHHRRRLEQQQRRRQEQQQQREFRRRESSAGLSQFRLTQSQPVLVNSQPVIKTV